MPDPIADLLDRFDFTQVHKALRATGRRWSAPPGAGERRHLPTVAQLRTTAHRLCSQVLTPGGPQTASSGGFVASRHDDGTVRLEFVLEAAAVEVPNPEEPPC